MHATQFITNHPCRGVSILCYYADNKTINKKYFKKSLITFDLRFIITLVSGRQHNFWEVSHCNRQGLLVSFLALQHPRFSYCAS